ncbi:hypothetical protein ACTU6U_10280 [Microbacterium sp. A196]|uniref:hypothetical protein n=1 Tax=Microbacterium sp. A196 TaxID=3457320 RepID=UPI003FD102B2
MPPQLKDKTGEQVAVRVELSDRVGAYVVTLADGSTAGSAGFGVVPVCPLFAAHLKTRGTEFPADGGVFRRPTSDDLSLISRHVIRRP